MVFNTCCGATPAVQGLSAWFHLGGTKNSPVRQSSVAIDLKWLPLHPSTAAVDRSGASRSAGLDVKKISLY